MSEKSYFYATLKNFLYSCCKFSDISKYIIRRIKAVELKLSGRTEKVVTENKYRKG